MLLIHTNNNTQKQSLQQQFKTQNGLIAIPTKQSDSLAGLIKSITYEYFHKDTPILALKIQQYITMSVKMHHSLEIYRVIMKIIKEYQQKVQLYQQYFFKMNQAINEQQSPPEPQQSLQRIQNVDQLFDQSLIGENHSSSIIEMIDIPILPFESVKFNSNNQQLHSQITKNSNTASSNQCIRQTLDSFHKLNNFFYSASATFNRNDWKTDRSVNKQGSKEIDSFKKKGESIIEVNQSLQNLLVNQMTYDLKRSVQESAPQTKQLKQMQKSYNKTIKNTLLFSKISLRRKK